ncbi:MAG: hypothetical protein QNJ84_18705 [Alphaproteobacteria bacterium]|nr:hypothetical protein [Alphaproteobacteria bacterium]
MFTIHDPENPVEALASIMVEAMTQFQHVDRFGLSVGAWFNKVQEEIPTPSGVKMMEFGLASAHIEVETRVGGIPLNPRYERIVYSKNYSSTERSESEKSGNTAGGVDGETPPWLRHLTLQAKASGQWRQAVSEEQVGEGAFVRHYKDVWQVSIRCWGLAAVVLNEDRPALQERMIGDDPLCDVTFDDGAADVTVSLIVTRPDIWVAGEKRTLMGGLFNTDTANRDAVFRALFAKALERRAAAIGLVSEDANEVESSDDGADFHGRLVLARARLTRAKPEEEA